MSFAMTSTNQDTCERVKTTRPHVYFTHAFYRWVDRNIVPMRHGSKILATRASYGAHQVSVRTAEGWLQKRTVPTLESIEIMAARCDDLFAELEIERRRLRELLR